MTVMHGGVFGRPLHGRDLRGGQLASTLRATGRYVLSWHVRQHRAAGDTGLVYGPPAPAPFSEQYRAAMGRTAGLCPIEAGVLGRLADNECRHGRLTGDRSAPCGCFPAENFAPALD